MTGAHDKTAAKYFALWFRLDGRDGFLLWVTNEHDRLLLLDGVVPAWTTLSAVGSYASERGISVEPESPRLHDLDSVRAFVEGAHGLDADSIVSAWNLFVDIAGTTGDANFLALDDAARPLYSRVFSMSDAARVVSAPPAPLSIAETSVVREVLSAGLRLTRSVVRFEPQSPAR